MYMYTRWMDGMQCRMSSIYMAMGRRTSTYRGRKSIGITYAMTHFCSLQMLCTESASFGTRRTMYEAMNLTVMCVTY
jgi:hypothetical protein